MLQPEYAVGNTKYIIASNGNTTKPRFHHSLTFLFGCRIQGTGGILLDYLIKSHGKGGDSEMPNPLSADKQKREQDIAAKRLLKVQKQPPKELVPKRRQRSGRNGTELERIAGEVTKPREEIKMDESYIEGRFGIVMEEIRDALVGIWGNLETLNNTLNELQTAGIGVVDMSQPTSSHGIPSQNLPIRGKKSVIKIKPK